MSSINEIPTSPAIKPDQDSRAGYKAGKRLFLGLMIGTSILLVGILSLLWIIPYIGIRNLHPWAGIMLSICFAMLIAFFIWSSFGLALSIIFGGRMPFSKPLRGPTVRLFLPLMTILAGMLNISREKVRASFIKVNNELVLSEKKTYRPEDILILLPHCLQASKCRHRLTYDINNCKRCGECPISGLIELAEKFGVKPAIATGGTIARRIVVETKPRLIIAVACERDLAAGIQDTYPIPVYGVLNERPKGPCLDTLVSLVNLNKALIGFIDRRFIDKQ